MESLNDYLTLIFSGQRVNGNEYTFNISWINSFVCSLHNCTETKINCILKLHSLVNSQRIRFIINIFNLRSTYLNLSINVGFPKTKSISLPYILCCQNLIKLINLFQAHYNYWLVLAMMKQSVLLCFKRKWSFSDNFPCLDTIISYYYYFGIIKIHRACHVRKISYWKVINYDLISSL